jgi:hypothetical protein
MVCHSRVVIAASTREVHETQTQIQPQNLKDTNRLLTLAQSFVSFSLPSHFDSRADLLNIVYSV